jgi:predicted ATP-dependent protease
VPKGNLKLIRQMDKLGKMEIKAVESVQEALEILL